MVAAFDRITFDSNSLTNRTIFLEFDTRPLYILMKPVLYRVLGPIVSVPSPQFYHPGPVVLVSSSWSRRLGPVDSVP